MFYKITAVFLLGWMLALSGFAHSELASSTPSAGETVTASPQEIELLFNGIVTPMEISIIGDDFATVTADLGAVSSQESVIATVPETLADGVYTVQYNLLSADGHPIQGSYNFSVQHRTMPTIFWAVPIVIIGAVVVYLKKK